jgi:hypothetical protein
MVSFMSNPKAEINWENFLDNFFNFYNPRVKKKEYEKGLTITYKKNGVYVWCDLDKTKLKIIKLEFGRLVNESEQNENISLIEGIFSNDEKGSTEFVQTSLYDEERPEFEFDSDGLNKNLVYRFLQTPCENGWIEEEYLLNEDKFYKAIVYLQNLKWTIVIKDIGEQDIPMFPDKFDQWLRVKIADAFWNKHRRHVKRINVVPMSGENKTTDNIKIAEYK